MRPSSLLVRAAEPLIAPGKKMRASQFTALPRPAVDALFLGDSITEFGQWDEWFPSIRTANRGISGDRADELLARLDSVGTGETVFILIGTNDLGWGRKPAAIASNVEKIVDRVKGQSPDASIFLQSVLPRTARLAPVIRQLNGLYHSIASAAEVRFVDLWRSFALPSGEIRSELTEDKLHLNGAGYATWVQAIRDLVPARRSRP